jgi:cell division protein FtsQ
MLVKSKNNRVRKNRMKQNVRQRRALWLGRMLLGLKLIALIALLLGVSALFVMAYGAVTESDYFRTRTIKVIGNSRLSTEEVLAQAGVRRGDNVLALNLRLVRGRLLDHAWIDSARVTREIPQTLTIEVREHEPLARIDLGRQFLLNTQGRIFKELASGDPQDLPLVSGINLEDIGLSSPGPTLRSAMQVLELGRQPASAIMWADMLRLQVDPESGITVMLKNNCRIKLGFGEYDTKYGRLKQLRHQLEKGESPRGFSVADLTHPDRVVVRLEADGTL